MFYLQYLFIQLSTQGKNRTKFDDKCCHHTDHQKNSIRILYTFPLLLSPQNMHPYLDPSKILWQSQKSLYM